MSTSPVTPSLHVKEIAFVGYPVTDLARARYFYEQVLGLAVSLDLTQDGKGWVEYAIGAGTIAINNSSGDQWRPAKDGPAVALEVTDFDSAITALRAAAVSFYLEPISTPMCRIAVVSDPDGNSIAIHQRAPK